MDPGKERFLRNYGVIRRFATDGKVPKQNFWDFLGAVGDLLYNFRREKIVQALKKESETFRKFVRKTLKPRERCRIFNSIRTCVRSVVIHLLNEKIIRSVPV